MHNHGPKELKGHERKITVISIHASSIETLGRKENCILNIIYFDYQLLFDKRPKEAINYSPPGNNENRAIKNSERQSPKESAT